MKYNIKIQQIRKKAHLSQEEFGEKLGVSRQSVYKWESGQSYPETEKLLLISRTFHVSIDYLLKDEMTEPEGMLNRCNDRESAVWTKERKRKVTAYVLLGFDVAAFGILWICSRIWPHQYTEFGQSYTTNSTGLPGLLYARDLWGMVWFMVLLAVVAVILLGFNYTEKRGLGKDLMAGAALWMDEHMETKILEESQEYEFREENVSGKEEEKKNS